MISIRVSTQSLRISMFTKWRRLAMLTWLFPACRSATAIYTRVKSLACLYVFFKLSPISVYVTDLTTSWSCALVYTRDLASLVSSDSKCHVTASLATRSIRHRAWSRTECVNFFFNLYLKFTVYQRNNVIGWLPNWFTALKIHVSPQTKALLDTFGTFRLDLRGQVEMKVR